MQGTNSFKSSVHRRAVVFAGLRYSLEGDQDFASVGIFGYRGIAFSFHVHCVGRPSYGCNVGQQPSAVEDFDMLVSQVLGSR